MTVWSTIARGEGTAEGPVGLLKKDVGSERVAHAYLFGGAAGKLPIDVALAFGAALVCAEGGCGTCEACQRVLNRAHPDVEVIEPAGMQLVVDQVRDAIRAASRRPVAGARRVIIVEGADRMNPTAQNAFLKTLEEPPPSTTIVLLAPSPETLLETVRSRCREVTFREPPPAEVAAALVDRGVQADRARMLARVGGGLERASALATDDEAFDQRAALGERVLQPLADPGEALEAAEWLAATTKQIRERVAAEHRVEQDDLHQWRNETKASADQRLRREQRRAEQDALEASVDDIASVLRDLVVLVKDPGADVLNVHAKDVLANKAAQLGRSPGAAARLIGCLSEIERARRRLRSNANVLLTLESIFLSLQRAL
jgi:DNA polymerase III subunit delta'